MKRTASLGIFLDATLNDWRRSKGLDALVGAEK